MMQKHILSSRHSPASSKFALSEEKGSDISFIYILLIYQIICNVDAAGVDTLVLFLVVEEHFELLATEHGVSCPFAMRGLYYIEMCSLSTHFAEFVSLLLSFDFFMYFPCKSFVWHDFSKCLFSISNLSFHSLNSAFLAFLISMIFHLSIFFDWLCFWCYIWKNSRNLQLLRWSVLNLQQLLLEYSFWYSVQSCAFAPSKLWIPLVNCLVNVRVGSWSITSILW